MMHEGHTSYVSNHLLGIHDFFQAPLHIVKKTTLHCCKHPKVGEMVARWVKMAAEDKDFYWAVQGVKVSRQLNGGNIRVDYLFMDDLLRDMGMTPAPSEECAIDRSVLEETLSKYGRSEQGGIVWLDAWEHIKKPTLWSKFFRKERNGNERAITILGLKFSYQKRSKKIKNSHDATTEELQRSFLDYAVYRRNGYHIDWESPKTFNEKMSWIKLYWQNPLITLHADKYTVRDIVAEKIGEKFLTPLLGVWDTPEEINFDELPEQFVLKVNWGCGLNIIVKQKDLLEVDFVRELLREWLQPESNNYWRSLEWGYKNIPPKIIAEKYLTELDTGLPCYKVMCFNGKPGVIQVVSDDKHSYTTVDYFDIGWNKLPFVQDRPPSSVRIPEPPYLRQMLEAAEVLSEPFPFVRVDFFNTQGGPLFSECTFYSNAGTTPFYPGEWGRKLGDMIALPGKFSA
ncbi:hypothetical protein LJC23_07065, partial [Desulfovibrio sp. OttesenSCG-928-I05]|nr:hypothetical protein [Desulfovibrio sp. OttesenSCG-928-I05]